MPPIGFIDVRRTSPKRKYLLMLSLSDYVFWGTHALKIGTTRTFIEDFDFLFEAPVEIDYKPVGI